MQQTVKYIFTLDPRITYVFRSHLSSFLLVTLTLYVHITILLQFIPCLSLSGHEDWIRALCFRSPPIAATPEEEPLILASGSQDGTIRLWNVAPFAPIPSSKSDIETEDTKDELLDEFEAALGDVAEGEEGRQVSLKRHVFSVKEGNGRFVLFYSLWGFHLRSSLTVRNSP